MNRVEFINTLKIELGNLPPSEVEDILYDYEEHFEVGLSKGKTEEEIARELGNPRSIAKSYKVNYKINNAENNPSTKSFFSNSCSSISRIFQFSFCPRSISWISWPINWNLCYRICLLCIRNRIVYWPIIRTIIPQIYKYRSPSTNINFFWHWSVCFRSFNTNRLFLPY